jgi:Fe(3+) dicitrate transport protein
MSKVDETFSDANNTRVASTNGNTGLIPAYNVIDLSTTYKLSKIWNIKAGINNLMNTTYFTRRAGGYPGPGALPADGRNFFVTVSAKL